MPSITLKNRWFVVRYTYWFMWLQFVSILETLYRRDELRRLSRWAQRKRLIPVRDYYLRLLVETEHRLAVTSLKYRGLARIADFAYTAYIMLVPPPRFYRSGAAARYRLRN